MAKPKAPADRREKRPHGGRPAPEALITDWRGPPVVDPGPVRPLRSCV